MSEQESRCQNVVKNCQNSNATLQGLGAHVVRALRYGIKVGQITESEKL